MSGKAIVRYPKSLQRMRHLAAGNEDALCGRTRTRTRRGGDADGRGVADAGVDVD